MKRIILAFALIGIAFQSGAQNIYDAMEFSQNNYYGTARTMALSNAVTAIGGDIGSFGINPAGSAVAGYSQVSITPGMTISSTATSFSNKGSMNFGADYRMGNARMTLPSAGVALNFNTGRDYGIKNFTIAFAANRTNTYHNFYTGAGTNSMTSKFAELANASYGYNPDYLNSYNSYYANNGDWDLITGYRAGQFSEYDEYGGDYVYCGNSEAISRFRTYTYVPGTLDQMTEVRKYGYKNDFMFNFSMNISDILYLGVNIGIPEAVYNYDTYYTESAQHPDEFPIEFATGSTCFKGGTSDSFFTARISGVYAKIGAIVLPTDHLRIGLAFQTPSSYNIREAWSYAASTTFSDSYFNSGNKVSPVGEYTYRLRTPYEFNAGIAYTFGNIGFVSVDYELMDYRVMMFRPITNDVKASASFNEINRLVPQTYGLSHAVRVGTEWKLLPFLAVRAGGSLLTTPERSELGSKKYYRDKTVSYSLGLGYSSEGSFYADLAFRFNTYRYPDNAMGRALYATYWDYDHYDAAGNFYTAEEDPSPIVAVNRRLFDIAVTFGWRF